MPCRKRHIKLHKRRGSTTVKIEAYDGDECIGTREEWSWVTWAPKWECATAFCQPSYPDQVNMASNFDRTMNRELPKDAATTQERQDEHKSNADRQGY